MAAGDTYYTCGTCGAQYRLRSGLEAHQDRFGHSTIIVEEEGEARSTRAVDAARAATAYRQKWGPSRRLEVKR